MTSSGAYGRDLTTWVTLLRRSLGAALAAADFDVIERVLGRTRLSDYEPRQTVHGFDHLADDLREFREILLYRTATADHTYAAARMAEIGAALVEVLAQHNAPAKPEPLPRIDARKVTADEFYAEFVLRPQAVVLDNWEFDPKPLQLEQLVARFGDEPQPLLDHHSRYYEGRLAELIENETYLANSDRLLTDHPELLGGLNIERFKPYVRAKYISSQIFASNSFAGSPAHFAIISSLFFQVEGVKRWTLIDPAFSYLTYPIPTPIDGYSALYWMDDEDAERCPLFRFCPRYEVTLQPGDVLFNPWYWSHAVVNLTPRSIGVAARWGGMPTEGFQSSCSLFDVGTRLNPGRVDHEVHGLLAILGQEGAPGKSAWFEQNVHGRRYKYDAELIAKAWGVVPANMTLKHRFAGEASS